MKTYFLKYVDEIKSEEKKWQKEIKTTLGTQQEREALLTLKQFSPLTFRTK